GYPSGAVVLSATYPIGHAWCSVVDNNTTNPDAVVLSWTGWQTWPLPGQITPTMLSPAAVPRPAAFAQTTENLALSNDATLPNTAVDVAAGRVSDQADTTWMHLAAPIAKNISGAWTAGGVANASVAGLDSGSAAAASATYHVYLIGKL